MTLSDWNIFFQSASVVLLALTFVVGFGAVLTGNALSKRQSILVAGVRRDTAEALKRAGELTLKIEEERRKRVEAEERLAAITERLKERRLPKETFLGALSDKPKGIAEIRYQNEHPDSYHFAWEVCGQLRSAGWIVENPEPLKPKASAPGLPSVLAASGSYGGSGVSLAAKSIDGLRKQTPLGALRSAFEASGFPTQSTVRDESLPENVIRVIIGPKI